MRTRTPTRVGAREGEGFQETLDERSFCRLFVSHSEELRRYAARYVRSSEEAEDIVQDVFLRVWLLRGKINLARDLRPYLYASTRNLAFDFLKHRRVEERFAESKSGDEPSLDAAAPPPVELQEVLEKALESLPPRQRDVTHLRWLRQMSLKQIGRELGISPKTVAIHLTRALKRLRGRLAAVGSWASPSLLLAVMQL